MTGLSKIASVGWASVVCIGIHLVIMIWHFWVISDFNVLVGLIGLINHRERRVLKLAMKARYVFFSRSNAPTLGTRNPVNRSKN
ncbi:MAG: hypothetical protein DRQ49_10945 [Gammaproteobacteria bacterium]|nr:MAG: hypothetical protein DRQ49_10945 [Gammaproteobacteria bacterium]RKZ75202.1 MAG: hypothetical protein DRQ57_08470 [Gammaproteobacteria bacterium]